MSLIDGKSWVAGPSAPKTEAANQVQTPTAIGVRITKSERPH
jgi:hypothetical protein